MEKKMSIKKTRFPLVLYVIFFVAILTTLFISEYGLTQSKDLEFVFPQGGETFSANEPVTVIVRSPTGRSFTQVAVAYPEKLVFEAIDNTPPYELPIILPYAVGPITIQAIAEDQDGNVYTQNVSVNLRPLQLAVGVTLQKLDVEPKDIVLEYIADTSPIFVTATLNDGRTFDFTSPTTGTTYQVEGGNLNVVTVSPTGTIEAVGQGQATVIVTNNGLTERVRVVVNVMNTAPQLALLTNTTIDTGKTTDIPILAADADGDTITLGGTSLPTFAKVIDNSDGTGILRLTPNTGDGGISSTISITALDTGTPPLGDVKTITVTVQAVPTNQPPVASAGPSQTVRLKSLVTLDGSKSSDPDSGPSPLSFTWKQTAGPIVTLTGATTTSPTFTPLVVGTHSFSLTVNDGQADSAPASVMITVEPIPGDLNGDGKVDCSDLAIIKASFGKRRAQSGYNAKADTNNDGIVDVRDLAFVSQKLPAGIRCP